MIAIETTWCRTVERKGKQVKEFSKVKQHFNNDQHYKEYVQTMKGRGWLQTESKVEEEDENKLSER